MCNHGNSCACLKLGSPVLALPAFCELALACIQRCHSASACAQQASSDMELHTVCIAQYASILHSALQVTVYKSNWGCMPHSACRRRMLMPVLPRPLPALHLQGPAALRRGCPSIGRPAIPVLRRHHPARRPDNRALRPAGYNQEASSAAGCSRPTGNSLSAVVPVSTASTQSHGAGAWAPKRSERTLPGHAAFQGRSPCLRGDPSWRWQARRAFTIHVFGPRHTARSNPWDSDRERDACVHSAVGREGSR